MEGLTAHLLRFHGRVVTPLLLNPHKGSALRGAFFHTLLRRFCFRQDNPRCPVCPLHASCPVSALVWSLDDGGRRGREVPRPFVFDPPLELKTLYQPGERFDFGLTLFSDALQLFPYAILTFQEMARSGIGKRHLGDGGRPQRGRFELERIEAVNPLTGQSQLVHQAEDNLVSVPDIPITHDQVLASPGEVPDALALRLLTPLRLIDRGRLVRPLGFAPLVQRLLERLSALWERYGDGPLALNFGGLIAQAENIVVVEDRTRWIELASYSTRLQRSTPLGGYVGSITFAGSLEPFLPWLVWGQFTHVGKDATKGNGWYQMEGAR